MLSGLRRTSRYGKKTRRAAAPLFEWGFFGRRRERIRFSFNSASVRYNFVFLNGPAVLHFTTHHRRLRMYEDRFFFCAPRSRVLEILHLEPAFVAMRAFYNLTDTARCDSS